MQLLKVQERINALMPSPASLAYLKRAVDGMDTEIPPFMALAGINEMQRNMEYASAGQPPEEPINQSLPKQVAQKLGLGQPMQPMQQGQPMQPGQPQGQPMQPPGQLAQGIAQPMPQQMPQQMAEGGLASIRIDPRMFDYGSGGVVSFAEGNRVYAPPGRFDEAANDDDEETSAEEARARLIELRRLQDVERAREGPVQQTADAIEAQRRKEGNYGADKGPLGEEYLTGLAQIQALRAAERERQGSDNRTSDLTGIGNALIAAGNATRGQSGMGAFLGGLGQQAGQEMMASQKRDAALRGQSITETELLNEAKNKVQGLRQAKLSGDVAQVVKLQSELADLANKARTANMTSLSAEITAISRIISAGIAADKGTRPTDETSNVEEYLRARRAAGDTRNEDIIRSEGRDKRLSLIASLAQKSEAIAQTAATAEAGQDLTAAAQALTKADQDRKTHAEAVKTVDARLKDFRSNEYRRLRELQDEDDAYNDPKAPGLFSKKPPPPVERQNKADAYVKKLYETEAASRPNPPTAAAPGAPAAATTYPVPNASAINALKSNQGSPEQFDAIFGPGAARKILGK